MTVTIERCGFTKATRGERTLICIAPARTCGPHDPRARHVFIFTDTEDVK